MLFTPRAQNRFLDLGLLLRGCRPKSRSLPGRVEVIQPVVRACTTFWLTSTRSTLTRVHRNISTRTKVPSLKAPCFRRCVQCCTSRKLATLLTIPGQTAEPSASIGHCATCFALWSPTTFSGTMCYPHSCCRTVCRCMQSPGTRRTTFCLAVRPVTSRCRLKTLGAVPFARH